VSAEDGFEALDALRPDEGARRNADGQTGRDHHRDQHRLMTDLVSPALRGLRWQYAVGRIDLATLERRSRSCSRTGSECSMLSTSPTTMRRS
jgi:hypothetical protein